MLLDYGCLRDHKVRPLAFLNDSKQCSPERREELFHAVLGCAEQVVVRVIPHGAIDRNGLHRSNLAAMRAILHALSPPAEVCLVDGFRLGPTAPPHRAVVDGDEKSAAIAAASIVAKVTRDRLMRRWTRSSRSTASPRTSATSRPATRRSSASAGPARFTAARFRRCAICRKRARGSSA